MVPCASRQLAEGHEQLISLCWASINSVQWQRQLCLQGHSRAAALTRHAGQIRPTLCRGLPTSYDFVWLAIFAWGFGSSIINFAICVWALGFFGRECQACLA